VLCSYLSKLTLSLLVIIHTHNRTFEEWLKAMDHSYGIRDLEKVIEAAEKNGLTLVETIEMPANNLSVILRKT
jgi:hypothetical protein